MLYLMLYSLPLESGELPSVENIDSYMGKLQVAISNNPDKHPDLVGKVAEIAKQLESVVKPESDAAPVLGEVGMSTSGGP